MTTTPPASPDGPGLMERLGAYIGTRDERHDTEIAQVWAALSPAHQKLFKDAAVIGCVRGRMAGQTGAGIPRDGAIIAEVIGACLSMDDKFPAVRRVARRAMRAASATTSKDTQ